MIGLNEFISRIVEPRAELYAMLCGELVVFDRTEQVVYIPISSYGNALMNPLGDFRTMIGHGLLWSRHVEVDCSSAELMEVIRGFAENEPFMATHEYEIYKLDTSRRSA